MGYYFFDPWLLHMAVVANDFCRIQDYDSDLLALFIASSRNIDKLVNIWCNYHGNIAVTCDTLLFMGARLYGANTKYFR